MPRAILSKWMKVSAVASHFGVSTDTILRRDGMWAHLVITRPTERSALVLRESVERLDKLLLETASKDAA